MYIIIATRAVIAATARIKITIQTVASLKLNMIPIIVTIARRRKGKVSMALSATTVAKVSLK